ncbi:GntR family transcriptional regulator [Salisediminibacterium beveridgei]|uniref:Transcriptional regulator, GntR family n=1 Tax=Salisediminibacterium beveridgei TaxID=632773 RepID=A0A1D7QZH5_9BACI|nr:GntR family transcriptional regulator [Salisediminibacterium beveridgei]AOM84414.1 Transcriptional regulator, GntR family [Salisediminibacterium beveridgei]
MNHSSKGQSLHQVVKDKLVQDIQTNTFPVNSQLPTEAELCATFNVSRTTIRNALQQLVNEGYIERVQGKGSFVKLQKIKQTLSSTQGSYVEQMKLQGKLPEIKVLDLNVIPTDPVLSKALEIEEGEPLNKLERIRYADQQPLQYEIAYLPWRMTTMMNKESCEGSLYKILREDMGLPIARTEEHLHLSKADNHVAEYLEIAPGDACIQIETYAFLEDGTKIEYSIAYFHGDKVSFTVERHYNET